MSGTRSTHTAFPLVTAAYDVIITSGIHISSRSRKGDNLNVAAQSVSGTVRSPGVILNDDVRNPSLVFVFANTMKC